MLVLFSFYGFQILDSCILVGYWLRTRIISMARMTPRIACRYWECSTYCRAWSRGWACDETDSCSQVTRDETYRHRDGWGKGANAESRILYSVRDICDECSSYRSDCWSWYSRRYHLDTSTRKYFPRWSGSYPQGNRISTPLRRLIYSVSICSTKSFWCSKIF